MKGHPELPVLVSGASGHLGRLTVNSLLDRFGVPADQIIATTRTPEMIDDFAKRGVNVRQVDFEDPRTVKREFTGARRALIISITPDEAGYEPGRRSRLQAKAVEAAREAGVPHVLLTSAPNAETGNPAFWHAAHYATEQVLINSGLKWTILRNWDWPNFHWYTHWKPALERGWYSTAAGNGGSSYIAKEDTAAAAAGALVSDVSVNRLFNLTGPEVLSTDDVFALLHDLTGKTVRIKHLTPEEWEKDFLENGGDKFWVSIMHAHMEAQKGGFFGGISNAVEELSGSQPTTMREYLPGLMAKDLTKEIGAYRRSD